MKTATENRLANSPQDKTISTRDEKTHIISLFSTRLTKLKLSAWAKILKDSYPRLKINVYLNINEFNTIHQFVKPYF